MNIGHRLNSWLISSIACSVFVAALGCAMALSGKDAILHWFLVPVLLCGIMTFEDALKWLRGDVDVFDPIGIIGLFGVHFFFLAPLLHVAWDYWLDEVIPPRDWQPWLGGMALLNFMGLLVYRSTRGFFEGASRTESSTVHTWRLQPARFRFFLFSAMFVGLVLQVGVYAWFGGLSAYTAAVEAKEHIFMGSSRIATIAGAFPVLATIAFALFVNRIQRVPTWPTMMLGIVLLGVLALLFGGLGGLRTKTIITMLWCVGILHLFVRPFPKQLIVGGVVALLAFMYLYGFYKSAGLQGVAAAVRSTHAREDVEGETQRSLQSTVLSDLGRSDVQAYVLSRTVESESDYEIALGRTYFGGAMVVVPGPLWRDRPPTKVKEGTEALQGNNSYRERELSSTEAIDKYDGRTSKVFGLAGEAMLNFGPFGVPPAFVLLGLVVGYTRRCMRNWDSQDPRRFMLPYFVAFCLSVVINDSEILIANLEEFALVPFLIIAIGSNRFCYVPEQPIAQPTSLLTLGLAYRRRESV